MDHNDRDRFDEWLDRSLQRYGEVEPRAGLEGRILANLAAREMTVWRWRWGWAPWTATAAVACLVAVTMLGWHARQKLDVKSPSIVPAAVASRNTGNQEPAAKSHRIPALQPSHAEPKRYQLNAGVTAGPRLEQFPSPRPLSEQEQLLSEYVAQFPDQAKLVALEQAETEKEMEQLYAENTHNGSAQER